MWRRWSRRKNDRELPAARTETVPGIRDGELADECDAFVTGRYAELWASRTHARVPGWAWINVLAHGAEEDLRGLGRVDDGYGDTQRWRAARAYLVDELLGMVGSGSWTLAELQRQALVPLELAAVSGKSPWATPNEMVAAVVSALELHRTVHH